MTIDNKRFGLKTEINIVVGTEYVQGTDLYANPKMYVMLIILVIL